MRVIGGREGARDRHWQWCARSRGTGYADFVGRIFGREAADNEAVWRGPGDFSGGRRKAGAGALPEDEAARGRVGEGAGTFYTNQFNNQDAIRAYMGIGRELAEQAGDGLTAFCGGVGTAGMIVGVYRGR